MDLEKKLQAANALIAESIDKAKAIEATAKAENRDLTDDETDQIAKLGEDVKTARADRDAVKAKIEKRRTASSWVTDAEKDLDKPQPRRVANPAGSIETDAGDEPKRIVIPAEARRHNPRNFTGPNAAERAYAFGMFCLAAMNSRKAQKWCSEHGIAIEAAGHTTTDLGAGSVFVPDQFDNELLRLREQFGLFRQFARQRPMASGTLSYNRRTGGLTAYFVAEQAAGTTSKTTTDQVTLTARDLYVFATMTNQLSEDSVISIGDDLAYEIAYAFANKEDLCGFIGDGTYTYGGITGVCKKLLNLSATRANIAGLVVGSGNAFSELVLGDFEAVVGRLPQYADTPNAAWYCHRAFWANVMQKLMDAGGGNTSGDLAAGAPKMFLGYPVRITQVMPAVDANDQVACLLGDLRLACDFGDRRGMDIAFSQDATVDSRNMFMTNETAIRGHERFDIVVHDVGNQSATAASRVPGPVVGLLTAAS